MFRTKSRKTYDNKRTSKACDKCESSDPKILLESLSMKTNLIERLLYRLNNDDLTSFLQDPVSEFLLNFFANNNGLVLTDPHNEKPSCRKNALKSLLLKAKIYQASLTN